MAIVSLVEERRGMVIVDVDGRQLCKMKKSLFRKLPLAVGDELDEAAYLDRLCQAQMPACYEDALCLLDYSARASGELRRKLLLKGYQEPVVDAAIQRLKQNRLIDDSSYAKRVVEGAKAKPVGVFELKRKLRAKGVEDKAVEEALELVDEDQQLFAAHKLAQKLLPKYADQEPRARRAKLSQALARRGFGWDTIASALEQLPDDDQWP